MGWSVVEGDGETAPEYIDSGIHRFPMGKLKHQAYKLRLIEHWTVVAPAQFMRYKPDAIVAETLPAIGFGNAVQAQLAQAAITTALAMGFYYNIPVYQIAAVTVKKQIGGDPKASKVKVRNGACELLPVLEPRRMEWTEAKKTMDESDSLGINLAFLGYSTLRLVK
jgi:Holliday junction resolvasome RuvABC endonuclease subunit